MNKSILKTNNVRNSRKASRQRGHRTTSTIAITTTKEHRKVQSIIRSIKCNKTWGAQATQLRTVTTLVRIAYSKAQRWEACSLSIRSIWQQANRHATNLLNASNLLLLMFRTSYGAILFAPCCRWQCADEIISSVLYVGMCCLLLLLPLSLDQKNLCSRTTWIIMLDTAWVRSFQARILRMKILKEFIFRVVLIVISDFWNYSKSVILQLFPLLRFLRCLICCRWKNTFSAPNNIIVTPRVRLRLSIYLSNSVFSVFNYVLV